MVPRWFLIQNVFSNRTSLARLAFVKNQCEVNWDVDASKLVKKKGEKGVLVIIPMNHLLAFIYPIYRTLELLRALRVTGACSELGDKDDKGVFRKQVMETYVLVQAFDRVASMKYKGYKFAVWMMSSHAAAKSWRSWSSLGLICFQFVSWKEVFEILLKVFQSFGKG